MITNNKLVKNKGLNEGIWLKNNIGHSPKIV